MNTALSLRMVYISNLYFSVFTNYVAKWQPNRKNVLTGWS